MAACSVCSVFPLKILRDIGGHDGPKGLTRKGFNRLAGGVAEEMAKEFGEFVILTPGRVLCSDANSVFQVPRSKVLY